MNRILFDPAECDGRLINLPCGDRRARHMIDVLHVSPGDMVKVGVLGGNCGSATVMSVGEGSVALEAVFDAPPLPPWFDIALAMPRPKVLHRMWAALASFGVRNIFIIGGAKVERYYFDTHWLEPSTYAPLLMEGLEQAGSTFVPSVRVCRLFRPFVEDVAATEFASSPKLVAHPYAECGVPRFTMTPEPGSPLPLLAIGPEGGWTDFELGLLREAGFRPFSIGPRPLRTDIATYAIIGAMASWQ